MPIDATDDFYCRSYRLLNMFRALLCPSSGAREYYTSGCCLSFLVLGFQVVGMVWSWGLCVWFAGCCFTAVKHLYNTLELLMMGIIVPETCWASNKFCNKNSSVASSWHFLSTHIYIYIFIYLYIYMDSNPAEAVGFLRAKKSSARLRSEGK